jgi:hypothetical protein
MSSPCIPRRRKPLSILAPKKMLRPYGFSTPSILIFLSKRKKDRKARKGSSNHTEIASNICCNQLYFQANLFIGS